MKSARHATCRLVIAKEKVKLNVDNYVALFKDEDLLAKFHDANLELANGRLFVTADQSRKVFGIRSHERYLVFAFTKA